MCNSAVQIKRIKKCFSVILVVVIILGLSACGKTIESGSDKEQESSYQEPEEQEANTESTESNMEEEGTQSSPSEVNSDKKEDNIGNSSSSATVTPVEQHTHVYSDATCVSAQKCSCGATKGSPLGHQFSEATCTSPQICRRCGSVSGGAKGHSFVNNICTRCGIQDPNSLPVDLCKLVVIDSSSNYKYDSASFRDTYGNVYNGVYHFGYSWSGEAYAIYNLNRNYKKFSGTIVPSPALDRCAYADYQIYVDDVLVYSQSQLERTTSGINFSVNVSNGTKLTIKARTYFKPGIVGSGYLGEGSIVNAKLTK